MNDEQNSFIRAGEVSQKILKQIPRLVFEGQSLLDISETIEQMIFNADAVPGFPAGISVNNIAAHYTPSITETTVIKENDVVKIDFGVSVNGCVSDQATTVDISGNNTLQIQTAKQALKKALDTIRAGVNAGQVSQTIETVIKEKGFNPISNLGGHKIEPNILHAGVFIANGFDSNDSNNKYIFKEGDVFAIEPFVTSGKTGRVTDTDRVEIFSLKQLKNVRLTTSREIMLHIIKNYSTLPFARRWIQKAFKSKAMVNASLNDLMKKDILFDYPILKDVDNKIITQAEVTVIVEKNGVRPLVPLESI